MTPMVWPSGGKRQKDDEQDDGTGAPTLEMRLSLMENDQERAVLVHMARGERSTRVYAMILGIADHPDFEQRRRVKQVKDRIKKRLERASLRLGNING